MNKNKILSTISVAVFVFCSISFVNINKAEAFSIDETVEYISDGISSLKDSLFGSSSSDESSDDSIPYYNSDNNYDNVTYFDYDDSNNDITTPEQLYSSLNNISTFSYQLKGNKKAKEEKQLSRYLQSSDATSTDVDVVSDYSFDLDTMDNISSLFSLDNNTQQNYDEINKSDNNDNEEESIDKDNSSIFDYLGIKAETAITTLAGSAVSLLTYLGEAEKTNSQNMINSESETSYKKEEDNEEDASEDDDFTSSNDNEYNNENTEDEANYATSQSSSNGTASNSSSYHLTSKDYATINSSIANLPDMSNICEPALLSTIENFISSSNDSWSGNNLNNLASCIIATAEKYNLNPLVICAQLKQESCFNPSAGSSAGAVGIAQFMPETASSLGINPLDVEDAINGQCQYMKSLMNSFGDYSLALAGYNAGGGAVEQYGGIPPYGETQAYVAKITSTIADLTNEYNHQS